MSLKHFDVEWAMRRLAERRIEEAMREGKFEHLEGAGKPLDLEEPPAQEESRLLWWALRILRNNDVIPDEVKWRKQIALMKVELRRTNDVERARFLAKEINALVLKLNTLGTTRIAEGVTPVDVAAELSRF